MAYVLFFILLIFHLIGPLGPFSHSIEMSVCVCVCLCVSVCVCLCVSVPLHNTHFGCRGDLWLKYILLILACDDAIKKSCVHFFLEIVKTRGFRPAPPKSPTSGFCGNFWSKNIFLILKLKILTPLNKTKCGPWKKKEKKNYPSIQKNYDGPTNEKNHCLG